MSFYPNHCAILTGSLFSMYFLMQIDSNVANKVVTHEFVHECKSDHYVYWNAAIIGYKGLLLLFGSFLAWETREVSVIKAGAT